MTAHTAKSECYSVLFKIDKLNVHHLHKEKTLFSKLVFIHTHVHQPSLTSMHSNSITHRLQFVSRCLECSVLYLLLRFVTVPYQNKTKTWHLCRLNCWIV